MTALLSIHDVSLAYATTPVLSHVSLEIASGEAVALLGPSGSGKSTLLRLLLGFLAPDSGTVSLTGKLASKPGQIIIPPEERDLAVVFQDLALWPHLTVAGNLRFVLRSKKRSRTQESVRIAEILDLVELSGFETRHVGELSGGEKQRVAIARALVSNPSAVLLDEPLTGLDSELKTEVLALFRSLIHERGASAIYVTHESEDAKKLGARMLHLEHGKLTAT